MKKSIILMTALMISTSAMAFDLGGLVDKVTAPKQTAELVSTNVVNRSNSPRAWCKSLPTNTICEKTFYDVYCIRSDYDRPELSIAKEIPVEGHLGACIFEKEEAYDAGQYKEIYKVEMLCEIQRDLVDNTYSCKWGGNQKTLIRKEKIKTSLGKERLL